MNPTPHLVQRHRSFVAMAAAGVLAGLLLAGCGSSGTAAPTPGTEPTSTAASIAPSTSSALQGCVPACNPPGLTQPGTIGPGAYTTQWFFGGRMRVSLSGTWTSEQDSTGEFNASPAATPQNAVFFWEDVYPTRAESRVNGVPLTAAGLLHWLQSASALKTTAPRKGRIGRLPATVVDVSVNKHTKNEDPNCPDRPCVLFLGFPQWTETWGIAGSQVQRFYLADVTYGGAKHLFVAVVYPDKSSDLTSFAKVGDQLLRTVRVPAASTG